MPTYDKVVGAFEGAYQSGIQLRNDALAVVNMVNDSILRCGQLPANVFKLHPPDTVPLQSECPFFGSELRYFS